jgi:hypothetical protein
MSVTSSRIEANLRVVGAPESIAQLRSFRTELKALEGQKARVDLDTSGAQTKATQLEATIRRLTAGSYQRMRVDADTGAAQTKIDKLEQQVQKLSSAQTKPKVDLDTSQATTKVASLERSLQGLTKLAVAGGMTFGLEKSLEAAVRPAATVQQNLKDIQVLAGATDAQIAKLGEASKGFVPLGAGATSAMTELARAGVGVADMAQVAHDALALAAAGELDQATAANALTDTMNAFQLSFTNSARVADLYAGAANASSATTQQLILGMAQGGATAHLMGESLDDTVSVLALFADRGIKGADAAPAARAEHQAGEGHDGRLRALLR